MADGGRRRGSGDGFAEPDVPRLGPRCVSVMSSSRSALRTSAQGPYRPGWLQLCRPYLAQQFRVAIQHLQQLDKRQRWFGLAVLVAGECVYATAENRASVVLVEVELLADAGDEIRIDKRGIELLAEGRHQFHGAARLRRTENGLVAGRTEVTRHRAGAAPVSEAWPRPPERRRRPRHRCSATAAPESSPPAAACPAAIAMRRRRSRPAAGPYKP